MDCYGASTRDFESDDSYGYDSPRRGGPLDSDGDYDRGYGRGDLMRERQTFRGERGGRDHRSGFDDVEDTDFGGYDRPTHRGLADRRGTGPYTSDRSIDDRDYEPRDHYRGSAGGVGPRGRAPSPASLFRRGGCPDSLDSYDNDSGFEYGHREVRGQGSRRGAISHHPNPHSNGDYSDDESEYQPRATREGHRGLGVGRGLEPRRRPDLPFNDEHSEDESDFGPRLARDQYSPGGRRSMAAPYTGHRGLVHASSMDDESEFEQYEARRRHGRDARGGMDFRRRGQNYLSEDDLDDSEDEGMHVGRRGPPMPGASSRRNLY
ncbi:MAG: hypothetical protein ALECFALPRED_002413 [Alectoria fallacina]|uniref:Uncharacterized protein n=1 Tax=Alectoria fallacina TaxID=1903189 RepID=A0A8H3HXH7_9LECA|nr:MAG: hypothetical protein ALECFALPRED_002413 [Alectoria fallacina]